MRKILFKAKRIDNGKWKIEKDKLVKKKVVAWMLLPELYKGE